MRLGCSFCSSYISNPITEFNSFTILECTLKKSWLKTHNLFQEALCTLSDVATPYSKQATPYTIGLWRNANSKWLPVGIFSSFSSISTNLGGVFVFYRPRGPKTPPPSRKFWSVPYCPVSLHRTACYDKEHITILWGTCSLKCITILHCIEWQNVKVKYQILI